MVIIVFANGGGSDAEVFSAGILEEVFSVGVGNIFSTSGSSFALGEPALGGVVAGFQIRIGGVQLKGAVEQVL